MGDEKNGWCYDPPAGMAPIGFYGFTACDAGVALELDVALKL